MHLSPVIMMMSGPMTHAEILIINMLSVIMDGVGMTYINAVAISHKEDGGKEDVLAVVATLILISGQTLVVHVQQEILVMGMMQLVTEDVLMESVLKV
jgi:hypothetical protein